jgi:hypothetical protein
MLLAPGSRVCDEEVVPDPPPVHRGVLLPAQLKHRPGCRDGKKIDGHVVYVCVCVYVALISQQHRGTRPGSD